MMCARPPSLRRFRLTWTRGGGLPGGCQRGERFLSAESNFSRFGTFFPLDKQSGEFRGPNVDSRAGESTAQTPRGAPRQNRGKAPSGQMFPPKTQSDFARAAVNRSRAKISLFRAAKILNPPRFRPSTCPNRRNSTRAARKYFCLLLLFLIFDGLDSKIFAYYSLRSRSLAPRPRWFGLAGECDALKSRDAGAASSPPRGWTRSSSWRARFSCSW